ncbi:TPA: hypothetical protein DEG21_01650 [Patescibacteria group bacterium]|nr:hypothetical protein [Candidatus Gracilibacteria bacterium]HBY74593.1 hypothetical protein [Candidatus Gracilibacteria bacterium]
MITYIFSDLFKLSFLYSLLFIFLFNITVIFYLQRKFTFEQNSKEDIKKEFIKFNILVLLLLLILSVFVPIINKYI